MSHGLQYGTESMYTVASGNREIYCEEVPSASLQYGVALNVG